jgi:hypothetical protein
MTDMGNYILKDDALINLRMMHENHLDIKHYFKDEFPLKSKWLIPAKIFHDSLSSLQLSNIDWKDTLFENIDIGKTRDEKIAEHDFTNAVKLYDAITINPVQASDPRLWAYLCHGPYFKFIKNRFKPEKDFKYYNLDEYFYYDDDIQGTIRRFINNRFFTGDGSRSLRRNGLSSMWWAVHFTKAPWKRYPDIAEKDDDYHYTKMIIGPGRSDLYQQTFERRYGLEPIVVFNLFDVINDYGLNRKKYRELIKKIESDLSFMQLATLEKNAVRAHIESLL